MKFHRVKGGKYRKFRLVRLGTTHVDHAATCDMCRVKESAPDPLYPEFQTEWSYYQPYDATKVLGTICYWSAFTHRVRYKAWTRKDLISELRTSEESYESFMEVQRLVIQQKKYGQLEIDLKDIPMPRVKVVQEAARKSEVFGPDDQIVTEGAFKGRHDGLTFKQAGIDNLCDWHDGPDGTKVYGYIEVIGEEGVFKRKHSSVVQAKKIALIDNGDPVIDAHQAQDNFDHVVKKSKPASSKVPLAAAQVSAMIAAALAQNADDQAGAGAAPAVQVGGGENEDGVDARQLHIPEEAELAEDQAEAALAIMGTAASVGKGRKRGGRCLQAASPATKAGRGHGAESPADDKRVRGVLSTAALATRKEKSEKDQAYYYYYYYYYYSRLLLLLLGRAAVEVQPGEDSPGPPC